MTQLPYCSQGWLLTCWIFLGQQYSAHYTCIMSCTRRLEAWCLDQTFQKDLCHKLSYSTSLSWLKIAFSRYYPWQIKLAWKPLLSQLKRTKLRNSGFFPPSHKHRKECTLVYTKCPGLINYKNITTVWGKIVRCVIYRVIQWSKCNPLSLLRQDGWRRKDPFCTKGNRYRFDLVSYTCWQWVSEVLTQITCPNCI